MITIVAKFTIQSGRENEFIEFCRELVEETKKEAGCVLYGLHQDRENPCVLTFIEHWKDDEAIAIHNAAPHYQKYVPQLDGFATKPAEVDIYKEV